MAGNKKTRLGELLVQDGVVTQAHLDHALQLQKEQEDRQTIGNILVDLGYLTRRNLRDAIKRYGKRLRLGQLLLAEGVVTREQLEEALRQQKALGQSLGQVLIDRGLAGEDDVTRALGKQLDMPYVVPHAGMVDMQVFSRLPAQFIRRNSVLPTSESNGVVTVLIADPTDGNLIATLEKVLGDNLMLATATTSTIDKVIEELLLREDLGIGGEIAEEVETTGPRQIGLVIDGQALAGRRGDRHEGFTLDGIISDGLNRGATDIHFEPQQRRMLVRYRLDGMLTNAASLPLSLAVPFVRRARALAGLNPSEGYKQYEGRVRALVDGKEYDLRLAILPSVLGETMAIHCFSREAGSMSLKDLGMLPRVLSDYTAIVEHSLGATLLAGPTGAGKTTSLYATLGCLNDGTRKIITIETPAELVLDGIVQDSLDEPKSSDVISAMMSAMQQDADVLALGGIVSDEVAEQLLHVSMMGHRVLSTLHAEDSLSALVRLVNLRGAGSFLTSSSIVILGQVLVRKICTHCSEVYVPSPKLVSEFCVKDLDLDAIDFYRGKGCSECMGTGCRGRTGVFEMLKVDEEIQRALLEKPPANEIRRLVTQSSDFLPLRQAGFLKAVQGLTTLEEVARVMPYPRGKTFRTEQYSVDDMCRRADLRLEGAKREGIQ